ncbi:extracellular solute-binding protein [Phototrophicus methaneseepsis]|uniref:Extracellular solute-binding protein n=1 Tax=Phototrophicus methaneseepsis TaxID=2710758 RepID=A0A7S8EDL1_9CHLR|nr:extracellular solute-binding protein [Phototrophicus methaneseepsis]QPC85014.1 extracellular solute-binding protein [Phototrophicus methaneseepsis]
MKKLNMSRRDFLKMMGVSGASLAASAGLDPFLLHTLAQEPVQITFGGWGAVAEDEGVKAAIEVFQEEHPEIQVEWQHTPDAGEYGTVLLTNLAAGTAPDTSFILSDQYETLAANGVLMDITDRIANDPLLGQENYFFEPQEAYRSAGGGDGRWYGIGSTWVAPQIYYNADLFDEMGITPPGFLDDEIYDWDTFVEICKQLTVDTEGRHPDDAGFDSENIERYAVDWNWGWQFLGSVIHSNGGQYLTDELTFAMDTPEAIEALQRMVDLIYVHHVSPRSATLSDLGMTNTQMLDSGRLAMAVDGSWALSWINSNELGITVGSGAIPKIVQPASIMQAHFHSALASSQHPDEAWEWIRFLATPFYQTHFAKIGLWLPNQTSMLTEEGLQTWLTEGIHPDNYANFVTDYLPKYGIAVRLPSGYIEASNNFITPAFDALAAGSAAADVMPAAVQQANDVLAMAMQM